LFEQEKKIPTFYFTTAPNQSKLFLAHPFLLSWQNVYSALSTRAGWPMYSFILLKHLQNLDRYEGGSLTNFLSTDFLSTNFSSTNFLLKFGSSTDFLSTNFSSTGPVHRTPGSSNARLDYVGYVRLCVVSSIFTVRLGVVSSIFYG
jgi:hypothetical protein